MDMLGLCIIMELVQGVIKKLCKIVKEIGFNNKEQKLRDEGII
jgi:hypothetical protein